MLLRQIPPTQAQKDYAMAIHMELAVALPQAMTFATYSMWLDKYAPIYRQVMTDRQLSHEAYMEEIDARRDW